MSIDETSESNEPGSVYADLEMVRAFAASHPDPYTQDVAIQLLKAKAENERLLRLLNTPEIIDFMKAVPLEAAHQRERWGTDHDGGKSPADWFWLIGYLAGKALHAQTSGNTEKALHHVITTAAALCNWHAAILGQTNMRPGIEPPRGEAA